ncbi:MAG TPA: PGPGW domain-containing protein [Frankiaceae bacterium]|nr:PGPGW domain-containing protein [Frankiaceae bacterium]
MAKPMEVLRFLGRSTKRVAVTVVGGALVVAGLAMVVLPGPGLLVVALGFAVLGTEYVWAAVAFERTKSAAATAGRAGSKVARGAVRGIRRGPK